MIRSLQRFRGAIKEIRTTQRETLPFSQLGVGLYLEAPCYGRKVSLEGGKQLFSRVWGLCLPKDSWSFIATCFSYVNLVLALENGNWGSTTEKHEGVSLFARKQNKLEGFPIFLRHYYT